MLRKFSNFFRKNKYPQVFPKYCRECKWGKPEGEVSRWSWVCFHPLVNSNNPWSLASATHEGNPCGSSCRDEREKKIGTCGIKGFLWEPK